MAVRFPPMDTPLFLGIPLRVNKRGILLPRPNMCSPWTMASLLFLHGYPFEMEGVSSSNDDWCSPWPMAVAIFTMDTPAVKEGGILLLNDGYPICHDGTAA